MARLRSVSRRSMKLCGEVSVVKTLAPHRRSCSGTHITSAVPSPVLGSFNTTVKVEAPALRRSARM
jgi:hypothetical protein